jgi:hypothetical protein
MPRYSCESFTRRDAEKPVHELRDPGIYVEGDRVFLLYSICGEQGLAAAELKIPLGKAR